MQGSGTLSHLEDLSNLDMRLHVILSSRWLNEKGDEPYPSSHTRSTENTHTRSASSVIGTPLHQSCCWVQCFECELCVATGNSARALDKDAHSRSWNARDAAAAVLTSGTQDSSLLETLLKQVRDLSARM